tara:strand:- start:692 stop:1057 length:366 start_codon:yes stop_codon:yes gene_type:complete
MNTNTIVIVIAVVLIGFGLLRRRMFGNTGVVSRSRLEELLGEGVKVVDVRTPEEFAGGHHSRAVNIPLDEIVDRAGELGEPDQPVVLYCASGNRSAQAIARLARSGYRNLINGGGLHHMPD